MMSIAQVRSAGSAAGYYSDRDNYYVLGSLEERWAGKGAEQLGLQGAVDKEVFTRVLEGRLPDGADLSRQQDGGNKHRPGYDLTFSAPKSVSLMAMLAGDKRLTEAHNQAVDIAVRQVEALASTRVMTDGQSETVLTGNLVMALFNHDTSRDQEPQLHTHAVVANVTQHNGEWKTLSSDKVGKTGFIENVYANQIAFGKIYRAVLKEKVEALGYETEVVGKHGMWEMPGVPVEAFSSRSQAIREAVGEDASLKSRDVAALDTRKSKQHVDPEVKMAEWMQTLKDDATDGEGIAQSGYFLAGFPWYEGNILFAFAVAAQALKWCEQRCLFHSVAVLLLLTAWIPLSGTSYGVAGVLVLVICYRLYRAADTEEHLALAACLVVAVTVTLDPLKIADGFYVVGQHGPDGNGRLLDFFFHQVGRRGITQVGSQFFNFD